MKHRRPKWSAGEAQIEARRPQEDQIEPRGIHKTRTTTTAGSGWLWLVLAGSGWLWLALAGSGWIWLRLALLNPRMELEIYARGLKSLTEAWNPCLRLEMHGCGLKFMPGASNPRLRLEIHA